MKKKTTIVNENELSIIVSEQTAKIIENLNKNAETTKPDFVKSKREIEDIPIEEQAEALELLCFPTSGLSAEDRILDAIRSTYGINKKETANGFVEVESFNTETLKKLRDYIKSLKHKKEYKYFAIIEKVLDELTQNNNTPLKDNEFSVLDWAAIFHYAEGSGYYSEMKTKTQNQADFIEKYNVPFSPKSFKNKRLNVRKRIDEFLDFPVNKFEKIKPFINSNFPKAIQQLENDRFIILDHEADR